MPTSGQTLKDLGNKPISDLIGNDIKIDSEGKVTGTIKYISEPWEEFDKENNTGHFFPFVMGESFVGKPITLSGRKNGDIKTYVPEDRTFVVRLENLENTNLIAAAATGPKLGVNVDGKSFTLDFTTANLSVEDVSSSEEILGKHISDLSDNLDSTLVGDTMKFTGDLKTITENDKWTEFDANGNNTGHFVPVKLPSSFAGNNYTMKGRRDGDRTVHIDEDRLLVVRLENLSTLTPTLEKDSVKVLTLDFTALVPVGEKAFKADKTDFGGYGKREEMIDNFSITWKGTKATVTGAFKPEHTAEKLKEAGCHLPIGMVDWYGDGIPKKGGINNIQEFTAQDMVLIVKALDKPAKFEYCGMTIMEFDISKMTGIAAK